MSCKINLTHRGPNVISQIDLFDECHFGADKLFFRGDFGDLKKVKEQISIALGGEGLDETAVKEMYGLSDGDFETFKTSKLGIGNPLIDLDEVGIENCPTIALNRYHIPNKKFWNNEVPTDVENPYKASAAVKFSIRLHFRDDFAYIDFGCPWEFTEEFGGELTKSSPAEAFMDNIVLFSCHFISKEDALIVLDEMFGNVSENQKKLKEGKIEVETTELIDEDGSIIAL